MTYQIAFLVGLVGLVGFLVFGVLFGLAALPAILLSQAGDALLALGVILSVLLAIPGVLLLIAAAVLVTTVMEVIRRACVLEELGVTASIQRGWQLARAQLAEVGLMWLLTVGVRLVFGLAIIPGVMVLLVIALLVGGGLGGLLYLVTAGLEKGWIAAVILGGLAFITLLGIPLTFASGLLETYLSTTWTLTYRELTVE